MHVSILAFCPEKVQSSAERVAGESFSCSKQSCSRTWMMHHPSVEQLIATTAACVCGFCTPAGISEYFFFAHETNTEGNKLHFLYWIFPEKSWFVIY